METVERATGERVVWRVLGGIAIAGVLLAGVVRASRGLAEHARWSVRPFAPACDSARGAHAALEVGEAGEACLEHLGRSDLSRAMLRSVLADASAPEDSRVVALRVLLTRAGDTLVPASDLASARAGAARRRVALLDVERRARAILEHVETTPELRRRTLKVAASVALDERARDLALHGLHDDSAMHLACVSDTPVAGRRARTALHRIGEIQPSLACDEPIDASTEAPPADPGTAALALTSLFGPDTEAADHAATLLDAVVRALRAHPSPERAAWIRSIALHRGQRSAHAEPAGSLDLEAALMGRPATPRTRAWLAVRLARAVGVEAEVWTNDASGPLHVRVGAETLALAVGLEPRRVDAAPVEAPTMVHVRADSPEVAVDALVLLPLLSRGVADCVASRAPSGDSTRLGALAARLAPYLQPDAGLAVTLGAAVGAGCLQHGPWPEGGDAQP